MMTGTTRCPFCEAEADRDEFDPDDRYPPCPACGLRLADHPNPGEPVGPIPPVAVALVVALVGLPCAVMGGVIAAGARNPEQYAVALLGWAAAGAGPAFGVAFGSWFARSATRVGAQGLLVLAGVMILSGLMTICLGVGVVLLVVGVPVGVYGAVLAALAGHPDLDRWCRR